MTIVCKLSKMVRLIPIEITINAPETVRKFKKVIQSSDGLPRKIISYRDPISMGKFKKQS